MKPIGIITDSHCGISVSEAEKLGVKVLPMPLYIDDECYYEGKSITRKAFFDCLAKDEPLRITPSKTAKQYTVLQEGICEGAVIGGNLCTINLLQGTPYMPDIRDKVLFVEDDNIMGEYFSYEFERNLQSLLQIGGADTVRGIVFGRFEESCGMTLERITDIIRYKVPTNIPVICGVDFGHIFPITTFPIGGDVRVIARKDDVEIVFITH